MASSLYPSSLLTLLARESRIICVSCEFLVIDWCDHFELATSECKKSYFAVCCLLSLQPFLSVFLKIREVGLTRFLL